jgi:hypothetical protein
MSYTSGGQWQKLAGLFRTGLETNLTLQFQLGGLTPHDGVMWVDDVVFKKAVLPSLPPRAGHGTTALVDQGQASAWIVYPAKIASYRPLAEKVQQAITQATGVRLPMVTDTEATRADAPVLKEPYRNSNLILLGRMGINRAIWPAYNRFLDATDGWYPGGTGHVVRTAANVLRNGKNHLILGGSNEPGAERAVDQFCRIVAKMPPAMGSASGHPGALARFLGRKENPASFSLPWLLDVELGGECLAAFQANDKLWRETPNSPLLPPFEAGYGTVRRWYQNAMAWYWSGWPSFLERSRQNLEVVLKDRAYTHQYPLEFFVRVYDMLDDSDYFTREQRAEMDRLLLQNFWDFSSAELSWMTTFSPPYDAIQIVNRHQISPWMSDLVLADFIHDYLTVEGDLRDVVEFRRQEKDRFLADVVRHRWTVSQPGTGYGSGEEIIGSFFRYALDHDRYEFFTNGNALRCARDVVAKISNVSGASLRPAEGFDHQLISGIVASYYGDGRFKSLLQLPSSIHVAGPFMGRYVNGVRRYMPGDEVPATSAEDLTGVLLPPMMPHNYQNITHLNDPNFRASALAQESPNDAAFRGSPLKMAEIMDLAVFRSGFAKEDDDVLFSGTRETTAPPQLFLNFASRGVTWFGGTGSDKYFEQNAVSVERTDRWLKGEKHYAGASRLDWVSNLKRAGALAATLAPFMDTTWRREIVWIRPGLYVVRDVITALEKGQYMISIGWQPTGALRQKGPFWTASSGASQLRISPLGAKWRAFQNNEEDRAWRKTTSILRQNLSASLAAGESVSAVTVLQAETGGDRVFLGASLASPEELMLVPETPGTAPIRLVWGAAQTKSLETDARVTVIQKTELQVTHATRVKMGGRTVFESDRPVNARLDWQAGRAVVDLGTASPPATVKFATGKGHEMMTREIKEGLSSFEISPHAEEMAIALPESVPSPSTASSARSTNDNRAASAFVKDVSSNWRVVWEYRGLQRPARIAASSSLPGGMVDLGAEYELAEISMRDRSNDQKGGLPAEIWTAPDEVVNGVRQTPAPDSPLWRRLDQKPEWRPSLFTGNYGKADPLAEGYQAIKPQGLKARYLRGEGMNNPNILCYRKDVQVSREPLRVEAVDLNGDGRTEIFVKSDIWPCYRWMREEDDSLAVVTAEGKEVFQFDVPTNLQSAQALDWDGSGKKQIVVVSSDAMIRIFEPTGKIAKEWNLYARHQDFNKRYGRPNTRHPAGGYTQPCSFGLWRQPPNQPAKMVVGRYGSFSFLNGRGELEGVMPGGGYWLPGMLPHGVDFNGDGVEETLCLGMYVLAHIDGNETPTVKEPAGELFYPTVYQNSCLNLSDGDSRPGAGGAPILVFETLPWGKGSPRYVLVVRENFLSIYDARERRWVFQWVPVVPMSAATITMAGPDSLKIIAATKEGLLWELQWQGTLDKLSRFQTRVFTDHVERMSATPTSRPGQAVLAGRQGLYLLRSLDDLELIRKGSFNDACFLPSQAGEPMSLVAATAQGEVIRIESATASPVK